MRFLDYQEKAVKGLVDKSNELLDLSGNKTIVFEAPTGSGKTIMMAKFLGQLIENRTDDKRFSFIWTAPRKLHTQSKEKLEKFYEDSKSLKCSFFNDLSDRMIDETEILFLNWESINEADNIIIRENEQEFNLENVIKNTIDAGRIIILIIDESHHSATTKTSRGLIRMLNPKVTIEVSATPALQGDEKVTVYREKVIDEEMIKKQIAINPGFDNAVTGESGDGSEVKSSAEDSANELIIKMALAKCEELARHYEDSGSSVNPLLLIQLPNRRADIDLKEEVIDILRDKHKITVDNGKLAIYLSGESKENLETITKDESPVEVMIFKQAIALGWDCPRASILVLFRDWRSFVFSIQTVGRIMRMPELKHYPIEDLNVGYIFTNLADISIHKDIAGGYATIHNAVRKQDYEDIELKSVHSKRFKEITRLSPKFIGHFLAAAEELELNNKITTDIGEITKDFISDGVIKNIDEEFEHLEECESETHFGDIVKLPQTEKEIQTLFDNFVVDSLSPLYPQSRSIDKVKQSIYKFFKDEYPGQFEYGGAEAQMVVLANAQCFIDGVNKAKEAYLKQVKTRRRELETDKKWEVPISINYTDNFRARKMNLSVMEPFYESGGASGVEKSFAKFLDKKLDQIEWWYKNGERDGIYFAVPYHENREDKPFYIDWIVKYKDGRIGLFDTKSGITAETAKAKAEGLARYLKEENAKGKNLFGGIVIPKDDSWWYNDNEVYIYNENDLTGWKILA